MTKTAPPPFKPTKKKTGDLVLTSKGFVTVVDGPHLTDESYILEGEQNMPSPSELARLEEEYEEAWARANDLSLGKGSREKYLQEARSLAKTLGYNTKPYNGAGE